LVIKKGIMLRVRRKCVKYGEELRCIQGNMRVRGHLEEPSVAGMIILNQILKMSVGKA